MSKQIKMSTFHHTTRRADGRIHHRATLPEMATEERWVVVVVAVVGDWRLCVRWWWQWRCVHRRARREGTALRVELGDKEDGDQGEDDEALW